MVVVAELTAERCTRPAEALHRVGCTRDGLFAPGTLLPRWEERGPSRPIGSDGGATCGR